MYLSSTIPEQTDKEKKDEKERERRGEEEGAGKRSDSRGGRWRSGRRGARETHQISNIAREAQDLESNPVRVEQMVLNSPELDTSASTS